MKYRERRSYGRSQEILPPPYLLSDVRRSFNDFVEKGITQAFEDISPIVGHGKEGLTLEFEKPYLGEPRNTELECKDKDLTYSRPLRVKAILKQNAKVIQETELYIGDFPMMTHRASTSRARTRISTRGTSFPSSGRGWRYSSTRSG